MILAFSPEPPRMVREARDVLRQLRELMATPSPSTLGDCLPLLDRAIEYMKAVEQHAGNSGLNRKEELRLELRGLRAELLLVRKLMDQAAGFYFGWGSLLSVAAGGYHPTGEAAPLRAAARISVSG